MRLQILSDGLAAAVGELSIVGRATIRVASNDDVLMGAGGDPRDLGDRCLARTVEGVRVRLEIYWKLTAGLRRAASQDD
jgi:hypothetical protein